MPNTIMHQLGGWYHRIPHKSAYLGIATLITSLISVLFSIQIVTSIAEMTSGWRPILTVILLFPFFITLRLGWLPTRPDDSIHSPGSTFAAVFLITWSSIVVGVLTTNIPTLIGALVNGAIAGLACGVTAVSGPGTTDLHLWRPRLLILASYLASIALGTAAYHLFDSAEVDLRGAIAAALISTTVWMLAVAWARGQLRPTRAHLQLPGTNSSQLPPLTRRSSRLLNLVLAFASLGMLIGAIGREHANCALPAPLRWSGCSYALQGHNGVVRAVAFSPDGTLLASVAADRTVRVWNAADGRPMWKKEYLDVKNLAFSPDGRTLAVSGWNNYVEHFIDLLKASDGSLIRKIASDRFYDALAWTPDGKTLAVSSYGRDAVSSSEHDAVQIFLYDSASATLKRTLSVDDHGKSLIHFQITFSPDGTLLAGAPGDGVVKLWRVSDGSLVDTIEDPTGMAEALAFSPDGNLLAIGVGNDTVRLIDLASRTEQRSLTKHSDPYNLHFLIFTRSLTVRGPIAALAFSPDGKTLVTGSFNGENVRLWKVADGTFVRSYKNAGPVWALAFSPDGSKLATGGGGEVYSDASLAIWQLR